jgi:circadian clock protein KaiB
MKTKLEKTKTGKPNQKHFKPNDTYTLCLYIAGQTIKAVTALKNLKSFCEEQLKGKYHIEVIDLLKNPKLGRDDQILAIPTLMRKLPLPVRIIIGDLSDTERLLAGLNLNNLYLV